jgi:hypothetical protein
MLDAIRPQGSLRNGILLDIPSLLPPGYTLATADADVLTLRRPVGTTVAMFSARGVSAEGILEAAREDSEPDPIIGTLRRTAQQIARRIARRTA